MSFLLPANKVVGMRGGGVCGVGCAWRGVCIVRVDMHNSGMRSEGACM